MAFKDEEKARAYRKEWKERNREKVRESNRWSQKKWYLKNREKRKLAQEKCELAVKVEVLTHYGDGKLACLKCGFIDIRALSIDHISGGGMEQKKVIKKTGGYHFYQWLRANEYPKGYQTLCMNCQFIKKKENREYADKGN